MNFRAVLGTSNIYIFNFIALVFGEGFVSESLGRDFALVYISALKLSIGSTCAQMMRLKGQRYYISIIMSNSSNIFSSIGITKGV